MTISGCRITSPCRSPRSTRSRPTFPTPSPPMSRRTGRSSGRRSPTPAIGAMSPLCVVHRKRMTDEIGGWRHYRETKATPDVELWQRALCGGLSVHPRAAAHGDQVRGRAPPQRLCHQAEPRAGPVVGPHRGGARARVRADGGLHRRAGGAEWNTVSIVAPDRAARRRSAGCASGAPAFPAGPACCGSGRASTKCGGSRVYREGNGRCFPARRRTRSR